MSETWLPRPFRRMSIKVKITLVIALTSTIAVAVACAAFIVYDRNHLKKKMVEESTLTADILDDSVRWALTLTDPQNGDAALKPLQAKKGIKATIEDANGAILAYYPRPKGEQPPPTGERTTNLPPKFTQESLTFSRELWSGNAKLGTLKIETDLQEVDQQVGTYTNIGLWILVVSILIAFLMASRMQRLISAPIVELAALENHVAERNDFTIRAPKKPRDEIGTLYDGFNHMLAQVEARDRELRFLKDQAEEANRTKDTFLANISHELRTPLNPVINYGELIAEMISDGDEPGPKMVSMLQDIVKAGRTLQRLIDDLLDLSKVAVGKLEIIEKTFEIEPMLDEIEAEIWPDAAMRRSRLTRRISADAAVMTSDRVRVKQVVTNLLTNANKFTTDKDGVITLDVTTEEVDRRTRIRFRVEDTGIGMTADQITRLFKPFEQADASINRKFGGSGLGLALSRKICQAMDGDITVESEPDRGSVFTIVLPRGSAEMPAAEPVRVPSSPPHSGRRRLLIVDDDPSVRKMVQRIAEREGFEVIGVVTGEEALEHARRNRPDLIALDVILPGMSGWAVLTTLKEDPDLASVPVVMLTMVDDRNRGFALGAEDFVVKPVERNRLARVLRRYKSEEPPLHVLLVEDDPGSRGLVRSFLEHDAWTVTEAVNGVEALKEVHLQRPAVILLDLMMPEMDGFTFLEELRAIEEFRNIPVIVLTAKDLTAEERTRLHGGADRVLQKDRCSRDQLEAALRTILARYVIEPRPEVSASV